MSYEHYRESKLGDALVEALGELVQDDKISQELALKVLVEVRVFTSSLLCQGGTKTPFPSMRRTFFLLPRCFSLSPLRSYSTQSKRL